MPAKEKKRNKKYFFHNSNKLKRAEQSDAYSEYGYRQVDLHNNKHE